MLKIIELYCGKKGPRRARVPRPTGDRNGKEKAPNLIFLKFKEGFSYFKLK